MLLDPFRRLRQCSFSCQISLSSARTVVIMAPATFMCRASIASRPTAKFSSRFVGTPLRVSAPRQGAARCRVVVMAADKEQVLKDVQTIIAEQLGTDLSKVQPESKFVDLGADSLDTVEIMMALEEKFSLTLEEEGAEKISTVQEAADLIAGQISK